MKKTETQRIKSKESGNLFSRFLYWFRMLSIVKHIFVFYLFITLIGSLILFLPISHQGYISYVDALFTAASAFSDTGLVTKVTAETWTHFGQGIIAILIFIGGIGWFALKVYLFNILFNRPISFATREALAAERGSSKIGATRNLIKVSVTIMIVIILIAATTLSIYFYFVDVDPQGGPIAEMSYRQGKSDFISIKEIPTGNWATSIRWGLFHSISAINNAGFDIMGQGSISAYYSKYGLQIIFILLFVTGGIGYPVIYDAYLWIKSKFTGKLHRWTLFTKLSMVTYLSIVILSIAIVFAIEISAKNGTIPGVREQGDIPENHQTFWHNDAYGSRGEKSMALIFNTMSTRNAGFSTIDMDILTSPTLFLYVTLMFIGSAPSSTAGGIRTTTFAIVIMSIWTRIRGREKTKVFNKRIPTVTVNRAFVVFAVATILVFVGTVITSTSLSLFGGELNAEIINPDGTIDFNYSTNRNHFSYTQILFEVASAFGTTGLSTGVTPYLSLASKLTLIFIMFVGQLGVSSSVLIWSTKNSEKKRYNFVKEDISIG